MLGGLRRLLNGTARVYRRGAGKMAYYFLTNPRRLADDPGTRGHPLGAVGCPLYIPDAAHEKGRGGDGGRWSIHMM